jgi:hypothetical protein
MAASRVRFSPGFLQEQDFQGAISSQLTVWGKTSFLQSKLLQRGFSIPPE